MGSAASNDPATTLRVGIDRATMRGRWLGTRLREHREAAGLKGAQVSERIARAVSTLSRWESGDLIPHPGELYYMLELYGIHDDERQTLMRHAEEARQPGPSEVDMSTAVADHVWLESRAWKVETFQTTAVHGLLQTADYARAMLMARLRTASPERIEGAVAARELRQRRLADEQPLQLSAILDEAVLRRVVGGPETMRAQLDYLVEQAALPHVEIRVIPFAAGAHASLASAFDVLRFRDERDVVFLETRGGGHVPRTPRILHRGAARAPLGRALGGGVDRYDRRHRRPGDHMSTGHEPAMPHPALSDADWRKSRHSAEEQGCVETAFLADGRVAVRDSKDRGGPALVYTPTEWAAFLTGAKDGEFDLP